MQMCNILLTYVQNNICSTYVEHKNSSTHVEHMSHNNVLNTRLVTCIEHNICLTCPSYVQHMCTICCIHML